MTKAQLSLFICLFSILYFSCTKENSLLQNSRLKMIRSQEGDSIAYICFTYDAQDRLITLIDSNNNGLIYTTHVTYDAQGKLSKVTTGGVTYTFEFDNKGKIIKRSVLYPGQQTAFVENVYGYDGSGRVVADSIYSFWSGNLFEIITYTYDQNNNIIESETIDKTSGALSYRYQCSYDDHPNPLNSFSSMMIFILNSGNEISSLGKNNLLTAKYDDGTIVNYTYEYNDNGFPKKSSLQDNTDTLVSYVDYYYE